MQPDQLERMVKHNTKAITYLCLLVIALALLMLASVDDWFLLDKLTYAVKSPLSQFASDPGENTVALSSTDVALLNANYRLFKNEFAVCFVPAVKNGSAYYRAVKSLNTAFDRETVTVTCPTGSDMVIHSHPNGMCELSVEDVRGFLGNDNLYEGIICGIDQFVLVDRDFVKQRIVVI